VRATSYWILVGRVYDVYYHNRISHSSNQRYTSRLWWPKTKGTRTRGTGVTPCHLLFVSGARSALCVTWVRPWVSRETQREINRQADRERASERGEFHRASRRGCGWQQYARHAVTVGLSRTRKPKHTHTLPTIPTSPTSSTCCRLPQTQCSCNLLDRKKCILGKNDQARRSYPQKGTQNGNVIKWSTPSPQKRPDVWPHSHTISSMGIDSSHHAP